MADVMDWEIESSPSTAGTHAKTALGGELPSRPGGLCVTTSGTIVLSEPDANRIRYIDPSGAASTVGGLAGLGDGAPGVARFRHPLGVAATADGSIIVADTNNHAIRRIDADGQVTTLAGGIYGAVDGPGAQARFRHPKAVAVAGDGTIVVADTASDTIRRIDADGNVTTLAGEIYGQGDLEAGRPSFRRPEAVAVGAGSDIYVADTGNDRVCRIDPSGRASLVGGRRPPGLPAAPAPDLRWPTSLATLPDGTVYVTDAANDVIRRISPDGTATVLAAEPGWQPVAIVVLPDGRLLAAETHWAPDRVIGRLRALPAS